MVNKNAYNSADYKQINTYNVYNDSVIYDMKKYLKNAKLENKGLLLAINKDILKKYDIDKIYFNEYNNKNYTKIHFENIKAKDLSFDLKSTMKESKDQEKGILFSLDKNILKNNDINKINLCPSDTKKKKYQLNKYKLKLDDTQQKLNNIQQKLNDSKQQNKIMGVVIGILIFIILMYIIYKMFLSPMFQKEE